MCIALLAHREHDRFPLILLHNRDEFHQRPEQRPDWIAADIYAGLDLEGRGTWLGVNRKGDFAFVTNYRDPDLIKPARKTRGMIPLRFLQDPPNFSVKSEEFNPFNLLYGNPQKILYQNSLRPHPEELGPGTHTLSNAFIDSPWPKTLLLRQLFHEFLGSCSPGQHTVAGLAEASFRILANQTKADPASLPKTGIPKAKELLLSSIFVKSPEYGTRCSTVVIYEGTHSIHFYSRSFAPSAQLNYAQYETIVRT